jgi:GNAT superfamily N-acetyltransferase
MSIPDRQKKWEELFQDKDKNLYVAQDNNETVGFISFGKNRDKRKNGCGEIYAVYLLKKSWNKGIGYALFEKAKQKLLKEGTTTAYLWVLNTNASAITSYRKWGGIVDDTMILDTQIGGQEVKEVMINFDLQ